MLVILQKILNNINIMNKISQTATINHLQKITLGNWTVYSLSDGYLDLDQKMFANITPEALRELLTKCQVPCVEDLTVRTEVHQFLIDTGEHIILVDAGCGQNYGVATGRLIHNLHQIGYTPEQISLLLLTHLHPDHVGGLITADGSPIFKNATVCVSEVDASYWRNSHREALADDDHKFVMGLAKKALAPYEKNRRLRLIEGGDSIISGITAVKAPGHTPGHTAFLCQSQNQTLLLWGDIVHTAGIQFFNPDLYIIYDSSGEQAVNSRKQLFAKAADQHLLVGGAHIPLSGLGYVSRTGNNTFSWTPLESALDL